MRVRRLSVRNCVCTRSQFTTGYGCFRKQNSVRSCLGWSRLLLSLSAVGSGSWLPIIPMLCPGALFRVDSQFTFLPLIWLRFSRSLSPSLSGIGGIAEKDCILRGGFIGYAYGGNNGIETTASQAFSIRQGVCRIIRIFFLDYADWTTLRLVMLNGFMLGIGLTHAWPRFMMERLG
jgi:hypothetical protein